MNAPHTFTHARETGNGRCGTSAAGLSQQAAEPEVSALRASIPNAVPPFEHDSPFDWGVMLYGGTDPRTGRPQPPLEFQFFAGAYSRRQIETKAADFVRRYFREHYAIRPPRVDAGVRRAFPNIARNVALAKVRAA